MRAKVYYEPPLELRKIENYRESENLKSIVNDVHIENISETLNVNS